LVGTQNRLPVLVSLLLSAFQIIFPRISHRPVKCARGSGSLGEEAPWKLKRMAWNAFALRQKVSGTIRRCELTFEERIPSGWGRMASAVQPNEDILRRSLCAPRPWDKRSPEEAENVFRRALQFREVIAGGTTGAFLPCRRVSSVPSRGARKQRRPWG